MKLHVLTNRLAVVGAAAIRYELLPLKGPVACPACQELARFTLRRQGGFAPLETPHHSAAPDRVILAASIECACGVALEGTLRFEVDREGEVALVEKGAAWRLRHDGTCSPGKSGP